jgi:hypothetical protein
MKPNKPPRTYIVGLGGGRTDFVLPPSNGFIRVEDCGALTVADGDGDIVAIFAAGTWRSVRADE